MNDELWREFNKYWQETEWKDLSRKKVEEIVGKYITFPIPKDINTPRIGRKFYTLVKEALSPKIEAYSPLEKAVFDMYKRLELGSIENKYCKVCKTNENLAGPISFFHIGSNFNKDKYKIVFVGKNTWYDVDGYLESKHYKEDFADARKFGLDRLNHPKRSYWRYINYIIQRIYGTLDDGIKNIAITNLIRCNTKGEENNPDDKTESYIINNCINCGVFEREIEILKPKRIIFLTGRHYDKYIKTLKFGYSECADGEDEEIDDKIISWSRTLFNKDRSDFRFILRVSHPQGKNRKNFIQNIMNWIALTVLIEDNLTNRDVGKPW